MSDKKVKAEEAIYRCNQCKDLLIGSQLKSIGLDDCDEGYELVGREFLIRFINDVSELVHYTDYAGQCLIDGNYPGKAEALKKRAEKVFNYGFFKL